MAEPARVDEKLSEAKYSEPANVASPVFVDPNAKPADLPGFPGSPARPELPEHVHSRPIGEWPPEFYRHNPSLERAAREVGEALGTAVATTRRLPAIVQDRAQILKSRLAVVRSRARANAKEKAEELKDQAAHQVRVARVRVGHMARENPAGLIGGVAATAFAIGMVLGIWRENSRV